MYSMGIYCSTERAWGECERVSEIEHSSKGVGKRAVEKVEVLFNGLIKLEIEKIIDLCMSMERGMLRWMCRERRG